MGHLIGRQCKVNFLAAVGPQRPLSPLGKLFSPAEGQGLPVHQHHFQSIDISPHRTIVEAAGPGGVAVDHAAQGGRSLGGVRGKELLRRPAEGRIGRLGFLGPIRRLKTLAGDHLPQLGQQHTRLQGKIECAGLLILTAGEHFVHPAHVHSVSLVGHGCRGQTGAGALHRHRDLFFVHLFQNAGDILCGTGKRNTLRLSHTAGFVPQIFLIFSAHRADQCVCHVIAPFHGPEGRWLIQHSLF